MSANIYVYHRARLVLIPNELERDGANRADARDFSLSRSIRYYGFFLGL